MLEQSQKVAELRQLITAAFPADDDKYESGLCGEFAYALKAFLERLGIEASVTTGIRAETSESSPSDPAAFSFSHVIVEALGTEWDWRGDNAITRWEERWADDRDAHHDFEWYDNRRETSFRNDFGAAKFNHQEVGVVLKQLELVQHELQVLQPTPVADLTL